MNTIKVSKADAEQILNLGRVKQQLAELEKLEETLKTQLIEMAGGAEGIFQAPGKDGAMLGRVYQARAPSLPGGL